MKRPNKYRNKHPIEQRRDARKCGLCTVCCTTLGVLELGKPSGAKCTHVCKTGCQTDAVRTLEKGLIAMLAWHINDVVVFPYGSAVLPYPEWHDAETYPMPSPP